MAIPKLIEEYSKATNADGYSRLNAEVLSINNDIATLGDIARQLNEYLKKAKGLEAVTHGFFDVLGKRRTKAAYEQLRAELIEKGLIPDSKNLRRFSYHIEEAISENDSRIGSLQSRIESRTQEFVANEEQRTFEDSKSTDGVAPTSGYTLLTQDEAKKAAGVEDGESFDDQRKKLLVTATRFAVASGISEFDQWLNDEFGRQQKTEACGVFLSSSSREDRVDTIASGGYISGETVYNRNQGLRPSFAVKYNPQAPLAFRQEQNDGKPTGHFVLNYGEYPQATVDAETAQKLELLFNRGKPQEGINPTGKWYTTSGMQEYNQTGENPFTPKMASEFEMDGERFVRYYKERYFNDPTWYKVEPIIYRLLNPDTYEQDGEYRLETIQAIVGGIPYNTNGTDEGRLNLSNSTVSAFMNGTKTNGGDFTHTTRILSNGETTRSGCGSFREDATQNETITHFEIPSWQDSIADHAYQGAVHLKSLIIPSTVTKIGRYAFDCSGFNFLSRTQSGEIILSAGLPDRQVVSTVDLSKFHKAISDFDVCMLCRSAEEFSQVDKFADMLIAQKTQVPSAIIDDLRRDNLLDKFTAEADFKQFNLLLQSIPKESFRQDKTGVYKDLDYCRLFQLALGVGVFEKPNITNEQGVPIQNIAFDHLLKTFTQANGITVTQLSGGYYGSAFPYNEAFSKFFQTMDVAKFNTAFEGIDFGHLYTARQKDDKEAIGQRTLEDAVRLADLLNANGVQMPFELLGDLAHTGKLEEFSKNANFDLFKKFLQTELPKHLETAERPKGEHGQEQSDEQKVQYDRQNIAGLFKLAYRLGVFENPTTFASSKQSYELMRDAFAREGGLNFHNLSNLMYSVKMEGHNEGFVNFFAKTGKYNRVFKGSNMSQLFGDNANITPAKEAQISQLADLLEAQNAQLPYDFIEQLEKTSCLGRFAENADFTQMKKLLANIKFATSDKTEMPIFKLAYSAGLLESPHSQIQTGVDANGNPIMRPVQEIAFESLNPFFSKLDSNSLNKIAPLYNIPMNAYNEEFLKALHQIDSAKWQEVFPDMDLAKVMAENANMANASEFPVRYINIIVDALAAQGIKLPYGLIGELKTTGMIEQFANNADFKQFKNLLKKIPEGTNPANILDLLKLGYGVGLLEDKSVTFVTGKDKQGQPIQTPVQNIAFTFLQNCIDPEDNQKKLKIDEIHMHFESMQMRGYVEEFLRFISNKTNFADLTEMHNQQTKQGFIPAVYDWFRERKELTGLLEGNNETANTTSEPTTEGNRYSVRTYEETEAGIDREKWKKPTVELLAKEFADKKFTGITAETRHIAEYIGSFDLYKQKHFEKAIEIDAERIAKGVPDHLLSTHLIQDALTSAEQYKRETQGLRSEILGDAGAVVSNQTDITSKIFTYEMLAKSDVANFAMGFLTSCCANLYGAGGGAMRAMILHPDIQAMVIRNFKGEIQSFGIVYVNREQGYAVVNDFEVNKKYMNQEQEREQIYKKAMEGIAAFAEQYNQENQERPIRTVTCGKSPNWQAINDFIERNPQSEILKAPNFDDFKYATGEGSWSGDWHSQQNIIWEQKQKQEERLV